MEVLTQIGFAISISTFVLLIKVSISFGRFLQRFDMVETLCKKHERQLAKLALSHPHIDNGEWPIK